VIPRGLGRGRLLAAIGSVVILVGSFLPWYTVGGEALPAESANAFEGAGIIVFVVAILNLALVVLPFAAGDQPMAIDRATSFLALLGLGVIGLAVRAIQLYPENALGLPDDALGLWVAGIGLAITAWGVAEMYAEPARS
jgi:hypothetical protein